MILQLIWQWLHSLQGALPASHGPSNPTRLISPIPPIPPCRPPPNSLAGKKAPFQAQGSPAVPLLAVLALLVFAFASLRALSGDAGLLAAPPVALLQQVALPVVLAAGVLALLMRQGKQLVDKPQLAAELAVPWH